MRYLRKFENFEEFSEVKHDIDGILCQLKDIGIDYEISNYLELIIIKIDIQEVNSEFESIISQLDSLMETKGYKSKVIHKDNNYNKYFLPKEAKYSLDYYVKTLALSKLNGIYARIRD